MALSRYFAIWALQQLYGTAFLDLPHEIRVSILQLAGVLSRPGAPTTTINNTISFTPLLHWRGPHPAATPPRNGSSLFLKLPMELRRQIFLHELGNSRQNYLPHCCDHKSTCAKKHVDRIEAPDSDSPELEWIVAPKKRRGLTYDEDTTQKKPIDNRATQFMLLCKKLKREVATIMYEERIFTVHIHEGIKNGGIEFVNSGRQKLQYQDEVMDDSRFARFTHNEENGFDRLKKIDIVIVPPSVEDASYSHPHLTTFFMTWSLCQLLQRSVEKHKLDFLTINFADPPADSKAQIGRRAIARSDQYLWDGVKNQPSTTTFEHLSDIEMILRPFSILRAHNITINLPPVLNIHAPTQKFAATLKQRILSKDALMSEYDPVLLDEDYAHQFRAIHADWLRFTLNKIHTSKTEVPKLTEQDFQPEISEDDYLPDDVPDSVLHEMIANAKAGSEGSRRKRKFTKEDEDEEYSKEFMRALAASMEDYGKMVALQQPMMS